MPFKPASLLSKEWGAPQLSISLKDMLSRFLTLHTEHSHG